MDSIANIDHNTYISSLIHVHTKYSLTCTSQRARAISTVIKNYIDYKMKEWNIQQPTNINIHENPNLSPIIKYIEFNNIKLLDFKSPHCANGFNPHNPKDAERFVLSHIYYITQS